MNEYIAISPSRNDQWLGNTLLIWRFIPDARW